MRQQQQLCCCVAGRSSRHTFQRSRQHTYLHAKCMAWLHSGCTATDHHTVRHEALGCVRPQDAVPHTQRPGSAHQLFQTNQRGEV